MKWNPYLGLKGEYQAKLLGKRMKNYGIKVIFCSPAFRCQQTANIISQELGVKFCVVNGLYEWFRENNLLADFALQTYGKDSHVDFFTPQEISEVYNMNVDVDYQDYSPKPKIWESADEFCQRTKATVFHLVDNFENFLIVGHQVSQKLISKYIQCRSEDNKSKNDLEELERDVEECSLTKMVNNSGWDVSYTADTEHFIIPILFYHHYDFFAEEAKKFIENMMGTFLVIVCSKEEKNIITSSLLTHKSPNCLTNFESYDVLFVPKFTLVSETYYHIAQILSEKNLYNKPFTFHIFVPNSIKSFMSRLYQRILKEYHKKYTIPFCHLIPHISSYNFQATVFKDEEVSYKNEKKFLKNWDCYQPPNIKQYFQIN
eukprot:TRINITY_DN2534_c0_g1_i2.p1 TRINITY_DN2534_c0_g1~~TRINITY_DN2534_c0_g1_i2.p1  ORF type:complete len:373 (-),score=89.26 TRINITY_DN2534_c0_g1_i2:11-1129(-)